MSPAKRINVFISSAMAELEYDREITQETLASMNVSPILFELFPALSQSPTDSYLDEVRDCDIFILLLWKSLRPAIMEEYLHALKCNKPILILVKSLIENEEHEPELKDFLLSLSTGSPHCIRRTTYKHYRSVRELRDAVTGSISAEIAKFYREPIHTLSREEMYELGTSIIRSAQKRLYLFQKTPSIILGARDYLAPDGAKYAYEKELVDALTHWITHNHSFPDKEFLYLFSAEATQVEIAEHELSKNLEYVEQTRQRLAILKDLEKKSGYRFRIQAVDVPISGPLIVGDNRFALWLLGSDNAVSISQENGKVCDILVRMLKTHVQTSLDMEKTFNALGICG